MPPSAFSATAPSIAASARRRPERSGPPNRRGGPLSGGGGTGGGCRPAAGPPSGRGPNDDRWKPALRAALSRCRCWGRLVTGVIRWRISPTILSQLGGLDAVSLIVVAPVAAGLHAVRARPTGPPDLRRRRPCPGAARGRHLRAITPARAAPPSPRGAARPRCRSG